MNIQYNFKSYIFDVTKFFYHLNNGEAFYTEYRELTVKNQNGYTCWSQHLSYKIDDPFIKNNYEKLKKLNILFLSK